jgi:hypothetical protein
MEIVMRLRLIARTLLVVLLLLAAGVSCALFLQIKDVEGDVRRMFAARNAADTAAVAERDLAHLPGPVQRWLRISGVVGRPRVSAVRLRQQGSFRMKPDAPWSPFEAEQYYTVDPPAFLWHARLHAFPLFPIIGRDRYIDGQGNMHITVVAVIPVADGTGPELDQGTLIRYLNETMWFPSAWLSDLLRWESVDEHTARVTMTYRGTTGSALVRFDERGFLTDFAADRYMSVDDRFLLRPWSTPIAGHRSMGGLLVPAGGDGVWHLDSTRFPYIRVQLDTVEYDVPSVY